MPTEAYGIFQGGGAKGFAYVGAIKEAEDLGIEWVGVAGTSAGAIVAALLASGYSADELYDPTAPAGKRGVLDQDLSKFFGNWFLIKTLMILRGWLRYFVAKIRAPLKNANPIQRIVLLILGSLLWGLPWFAIWIPLVLVFLVLVACNVLKYGIITTDTFREWLNERMIEGIRKTNPAFSVNTASGLVQFKDMKMNLKIIASHVSEKRMHSFPTDGYDDVSVAEAVCASISIPFVFQPKRIQGFYFVDGGIVSNFPAWVFDSEQSKLKEKLPVIGFSLQDVQIKENTHRRLWPLEFLFSVGATVLQGQWALSTRSIDKLTIIKIVTTAELLDFDMDDISKARTYKEGSEAVRLLPEFR